MSFILIMVVLLAAACTSTTAAPLTYETLPETGDAARGEQIFSQQINLAPPCLACHNPAAPSPASPDLTGFGEIAGSRVEGLSAREYAFYSIVEPERYLVEGYGNAMYNQYHTRLAPQDIADLVAYILTL